MVPRLVMLGALLATSVVCSHAESPAADPPSLALSADDDRNVREQVVEFAVAGSATGVKVCTGAASGPCWLAELPLGSGRPGAAVEPILLPAAPGETIVLPRFEDAGGIVRDRLFSRWSVTSRPQQPVRPDVSPRYAEVEHPARSAAHPLLRSKKGLGGFDVRRGFVSDLDELGIATVTVNVPLDFLRQRTATADGSPAHEYGGAAYDVDAGAIAALDATLRAAAEREILVFAILLVPPPRDSSPISRLMAHPDYEPPAHFAMPRVDDPRGIATYAAAIDYLAGRYAGEDDRHGRIHHWIVHNEVDAGREWTNAGRKSLVEYVDLYHRSLRIVHQLVRLRDPQARAFVSLTHSWRQAERPEYYSGREVLAELVARSRAEGDFDWGIAYHPYPQSLLVPETWNDDRAPRSADAPFVTFKNIEVLAEWVRRPEHRFRGATCRDVFLTEQGFHSRDYSPEQLALQAAGLAYAWHAIRDLPEIKGMHYHNWIDNRAEFGLRIGLRRFPDDPDDPGGPKRIWELYRKLGGPEEAAACEFALPLVGVDAWDEAFPGPADEGRGLNRR